ncbi:MAG: nicotinate (nicotinamide) nucleotide adenylyltransferase [Verrucomicrobiota bacterium]
MKIALFGGTFDPIHLGHGALAERAASDAELDRVIFIPCQQSPHKTDSTQATGEQRCEMIRLATAELNWAEVSTLELERDSPSFSWQTAQHFSNQYPDDELFWILGADQWVKLETWAKPNLLAQLTTFLVFARGNDVLEEKPGFRYLQLRDFDHPASATEARNSHQAAERFLHPGVFQYAMDNQLYDWKD